MPAYSCLLYDVVETFRAQNQRIGALRVGSTTIKRSPSTSGVNKMSFICFLTYSQGYGVPNWYVIDKPHPDEWSAVPWVLFWAHVSWMTPTEHRTSSMTSHTATRDRRSAYVTARSGSLLCHHFFVSVLCQTRNCSMHTPRCVHHKQCLAPSCMHHIHSQLSDACITHKSPFPSTTTPGGKKIASPAERRVWCTPSIGQ